MFNAGKVSSATSSFMPIDRGSTNGKPVIRVLNLHKTYEMGDTRVHALRGMSLEVHGGEFVTVMGASGSGKSTFMNLLGGLDKPTEYGRSPT